ncbi:MAG: PG0541 family transporter-associated protein [Kiritimatiellia bacterium]
MKAVWMMHDIVLTDAIQDLLDELGVIGLSRWKRMTGRGPKSGARMDTHVWPGANSGAFVVVDDEMAARLLGRLQALRDEVGAQTGLWAFTTPVLETLK